MSYTMEDFRRDFTREHLKDLTPEERLQGLSPGERLDGLSPEERLEGLFGELSELAGQRNAIDGRIVEIVAEIDRDGLCGITGARSVAGLVAWKLGLSSVNAKTIATVAGRLEEFPQCAAGMREGPSGSNEACSHP